MDFKKNLKIRLSAVGKMYIVCGLLTNARTCLYQSVTSSYFGLDPPPLWTMLLLVSAEYKRNLTETEGASHCVYAIWTLC